MELLHSAKAGLIIIDAQERLMQAMERAQQTTGSIAKLLHLARLFDLPVIVTEQNPRFLGPTLMELKEILPTEEPIEKMHFNCCDVEPFITRLNGLDLQNIILAGIETHICIFQTCIALLNWGHTLHVPADAVDSRTAENRRVGLDLMRQTGACITSTETVIYQILEKAGTPEFKEMLKLVK